MRHYELAAGHAEECDKSHEQVMHDKAARGMNLHRDPDYDSHLGIERSSVKVPV